MTDDTPFRLAEELPSELSSLLDSAPTRDSDAVCETPAALIRALEQPQSISGVPIVTPEIQDGVVAFIDALGTCALMNRVGKEGADDAVARDVYSTTMGMVGEFQTNINDLSRSVDGIKNMVISDSFVVAVPFTADAIYKLVEFLAKFQFKCLASYSQALRGAVSKGKIIGNIPENRIIGSAFIAAHSTEKSIAFFPRIVIDRQILEDATLKLNESKMPIAIDKDGISYVDFMKNETHGSITVLVDAKRQEYINKPDVLQKWNWLRTFLEQKTNNRLNCCNSPVSPLLPHN
jgi:hypothetical protein